MLIKMYKLPLLFCLLLCFSNVFALNKKVLVLHSYHESFYWTENVMKGIKSSFNEADANIEVFVEYMDTKRYPPEISFPVFKDFYQKKYSKTKFDVIILSDNNALNFVLELRDSLFAGVPVVFSGINNFREDMLRGDHLITGVTEEINIFGTIELARKIFPGVKRFIAISDLTETGKANTRKLFEVIRRKKLNKEAFEVWDNITLETLKKKISNLPKGVAVLQFTFHRDKEDNWFTLEQYLGQITKNSNRPVFSFWDHYLDKGIIGGNLVFGREQGRRAGLYALKILRGTNIKDLPIIKSPNKNILDYSILQKYNINSNSLDKSIRIISRPHSILDVYKYELISLVIILIILVSMVIVLLINIILRKNAEKILRESEEKFRTITESSADAIFIIDNNANYIYTNQAATELLGYSANEFLNMNVVDLVPSGNKEVELNRLDEIIEKGKLYVETALVKRDGTKLHVDLNAIVISPNAIYGSCRDITERIENRKLSMQLLQANKLESIGRLAGGVAHDFNNMLSIIIANSELLLEEVKNLDPFLSDLVGNIMEAATRSSKLTKQLLTFAKGQPVAPKVLDLNKSIDGMIEMVSKLIGENINLTWKPHTEALPIKIDPAQVDQILVNICSNAGHAIDGNGDIVVKTSALKVDSYKTAHGLEIAPGDYICLEISDNGSGIDRDIISKIFEPFFTKQSHHPGTGLGLATVYGIVKQNTGLIEVESEVGVGTTFKIHLPRNMEVISEKQIKSATVLRSKNKETILIVEDELLILETLATMLRNLDYKVLTANSPHEAIDIINNLKDGDVDIILSDVIMPEMNGVELTQRLMDSHKNVKCLLMSGYTGKVVDQYGDLSKEKNFIHKPFTTIEISNKLREVLDN